MIKSISLVLFFLSSVSFADCSSWESGKYKSSAGDESAMDDTVAQAFGVQNAKKALVSFDKCIFKVKPSFDSTLKVFDYSKDDKKCQEVKMIFEMNLIGCESSGSIGAPSEAINKKKNGAQ